VIITKPRRNIGDVEVNIRESYALSLYTGEWLASCFGRSTSAEINPGIQCISGSAELGLVCTW